MNRYFNEEDIQIMKVHKKILTIIIHQGSEN